MVTNVRFPPKCDTRLGSENDPLLTFRGSPTILYIEHPIGVDMRAYEPTDRALIDLRDQRTDLAIRISLLRDCERPDEIILIGLRRDLELLDRRIATHRSGPGA